MANAIISVRDVHKHYKNVKALNGVSIEIPEGKVFGLLGPNGAGKTTLIKILTTLIQPDQGEVTVGGHNVVKDPQKVRDIIGLAGQYAAVDEHLTARENLKLFGNLYHIPTAKLSAKVEELLTSFNLQDAADRTLKTYSGGMRRRLDLAVSLISEPKIVFLDEPTTGLDPQSRNSLWEVIKDLVSNGTTILLTTQYLDEADYLAEQIAVIDEGRVVAQGSAKELKQKIGEEFLEIHIAKGEHWKAALAALKELSIEAQSAEEGDGRKIVIKTGAIAKDILKVLSAFEQKGVEISDLDARKPTLDDVFLSLTEN